MLRTKYTANLISALTIVLFAIITVLALLIVRGNTISPDGVTATGTIRLLVTPTTELAVYLDEKPQKVSTGNVVESVPPGNYTIRVERNGYASWKQNIEVKVGLVTDVTAQLFPQALNLSQVTQTNIDTLAFTSDNRQVFYFVSDSPLGSEIGLWKNQLQNSAIISFTEDTPVKIANVTELESIIPSPDGGKLVIKINEQFNLLDGNSLNVIGTDTVLNFPFPVDTITWLTGDNLLVVSDQLLIDYQISTEKYTLITYQGKEIEPTYAISDSTVIFLWNNTLYKYSNGVTAPLKLENISLPENIVNIYTADTTADYMLLQTVTDELYAIFLPQSYIGLVGKYELLSQGPDGSNFLLASEDGKLIAGELKISIIQKSAEIALTESSLSASEIEALVWDTGSKYFIFRYTSDLSTLWAADTGGGNLTDLLTSDRIVSPMSACILPGGEEIVLLLRDDTTSPSRQNLYSLKLGE